MIKEIKVHSVEETEQLATKIGRPSNTSGCHYA